MSSAYSGQLAFKAPVAPADSMSVITEIMDMLTTGSAGVAGNGVIVSKTVRVLIPGVSCVDWQKRLRHCSSNQHANRVVVGGTRWCCLLCDFSGHCGGSATPQSAEEMLDGQHQRVDIPAHDSTAHSGSVASRLQNCKKNPAKYIYRPHKWKASAPTSIRRNELFCRHYNFAIVVGKAAIFHHRLELGLERTLLDFSFGLSKKQKIVAAEE